VIEMIKKLNEGTDLRNILMWMNTEILGGEYIPGQSGWLQWRYVSQLLSL